MNNFSIQSLYNWYRTTLRNPKYRWWIVLGTFMYLLSPFDIAPDFIPVAGQIDDLAVLTLLVAELSQWIIDEFKSRRGKTTVNPQPHNNTTETVEVDAVSVQ